jgi:hypothetical protein
MGLHDVQFPILSFGSLAWARFITFHCPRRDERFAMTWWYSTGGLNSKSVHCGLDEFGQRE